MTTLVENMHEEARRLEAVRRYDILDTPPDGAFDRITALAARRFGVPIAIVSIVDSDRIWFKSRHGLDIAEVDRSPGLCASAILSDAPYIVPDARKDPRALVNPLVAGSFGLRFYAGVPLTTHDGYKLGTLCVIDREPRPIEPGQIDDLVDLAAVVMDQIELRLSARRAVAQAELMAREIDHRVMNSLQFVASLLTMQSRMAGAADVAGHLEMAASRVAAVARVHRHFYLEQGETVSCTAFLQRLCADLSDILARPLDVTGDEGEVPARLIQPIGLIVNELVTNAAKHGAGRIRIRYRSAPPLHALCVCDDGAGPPEGAIHGLGMKVVGSLARQLGGELRCERGPDGNGCCFTLRFTLA